MIATARAPSHRHPKSAAPTRERIKNIAQTLYVLHGYNGFSFGDIAERLGTTRANIHHHFGSKRALMAELIELFADDAQRRLECNWLRTGVPFRDRLSSQLDDFRRFYTRFNKRSNDRQVWSPMSRLQHDLEALGPPVARALERVNQAFAVSLRAALTEAVETGELAKDTPIDDLVRILCAIVLSCPPLTQVTGTFAELERLFSSLERTIMGTWGTRQTPRRARKRVASYHR